jgi:tetratricopeptide (TPR) repeat protein
MIIINRTRLIACLFFDTCWENKYMHIRILSVCLLFSLFVFASGCKKDSMQTLRLSFEEQDYEKTVEIAQALLEKSINSEYLFWEAKANSLLGNTTEAYSELSLHLAMIDGNSDSWQEANELMCRIGLQVGQYNRVVESARTLEQLGVLQGAFPQYYYQALVALKQSEQANEVFARYLKGTIDSYQYAKMLIAAKANAGSLGEAFSVLSPDEQLALLEFAASDTVTLDYANGLLKLAIPLEQSFTGKAELKRVYLVLENLYGFANQRVQQRKYGTLANK